MDLNWSDLSFVLTVAAIGVSLFALFRNRPSQRQSRRAHQKQREQPNRD